jgi:hypothetical protein
MTWRRLARAGAGSAVAAILAGASIGAAQAPTPVTAVAGQIAGTVSSAADDRPIGRARVMAVAGDAEPHVTLTGADGKFVLSNLPAGSYTISVTRTGYAPQTYGQGRRPAPPVTLAANQGLTSIDVALQPAGHIAGRILDEDGTPFAGALVDALVARSEGGMGVLVSAASSRTDDRGEFRLHGLAPGQYFVSAADPAFRSVASPAGVLRYSPTYHPGVASADEAKPIVVSASGETAKVEFKLKLVPPARVSGQLVAFNARELLSAAILMSPIFPDGRFSFSHVTPGRYRIRARGQTEATGAALFAAFSIDVRGTDIDGIRMSLRPGAVIDGTLTVEAHKKTKPPRLPTLRVRAPSIDGNSFGESLTGTVKPDGSFALRGVVKGAHQIVVDGLEAPWVLKDVFYRGANITDRVLDLEEHEQVRSVRITISDLCSDVSGVVQNRRKQPVANAAVLVFSRVAFHWMPTNRRMRAAYTDREGRFSIAGLPAGDYLAVASMEIDESDLGRRERLRALESLATPLRLETDDARATLTLQVAAVPAQAVR